MQVRRFFNTRLRKSIVSLGIIGLVFLFVSSNFQGIVMAQSSFDTTVQNDLTFAAQQLNATAGASSKTAYPQLTDSTGKWVTTAASAWTSGFLPGSLWLMYQQTGNSAWMTQAQTWQAGVKSQDTNTTTHDVGFMLFNSYGNGYLLTNDDTYRQVVLTAAASLATRYNATVGAFKSWDGASTDFKVIIDNMMNLELMFWASQHGGSSTWYNMAVSHALVTSQQHVRADGSTFHLVNFNPTTGAVQSRGTVQGYSDSSTWARGQAWAIYGFTMAYRYTNDALFLATAEKVANYYVSHLPSDSVPYWDFNAPGIPNEPRDTSAAAIAASGLLELSTHETNATLKSTYFNTAKNTLISLSSSAYLAKGTTNKAILLHGTANKPAGSFDTGLIYGDYYFIEALIRYQKIAAAPPTATNIATTIPTATKTNTPKPTNTATATDTSTAKPTNTPTFVPPTATNTPTASNTTTYQAEDATLSNAILETTHLNYTGTGYVDYTNAVGGYVEFNVTAAQAGIYHLAFRFANAGTADRPMEIKVNGTVINPSLSFPLTGSWDTWQTQTVGAVLKAGANTVRATGITTDGGPNLDKLDVTFSQAVTPTTVPSATNTSTPKSTNTATTVPTNTSTPKPTTDPTITPTSTPSTSLQVSLLDPAAITQLKAKIAGGDHAYDTALNKLISNANSALNNGTYSVTTKPQTPPSGTKHDYMSQARYWWPDPTKPNGLPYIQKDGQTNPEIYKIPDHASLDNMVADVNVLSLAYYLKGNQAYADHAELLIRTWFLNASTKMNPNMQYAQMIPGHTEVRGEGILDSQAFSQVLDGVGLLAGSPTWTSTDQQNLQAWFSQYLNWLQTSANGQAEENAANNHGTWYMEQAAPIALFIGNKTLATQFINGLLPRLANQIATDGHQPLEVTRADGWHYSNYDLQAWFKLAFTAKRVGLDLWNYKTSDGRSLRKALDFLQPATVNHSAWPYSARSPWDNSIATMLFYIAGVEYNSTAYLTDSSKIADSSFSSSINILWYPK